ncbi:hypothetical protein IMZ48_38480, partial [Candidatus Bathyarchaeota archaeon]|nr:hypothetical protein [Candidatus Bathyarchaeota archaeon]
TFGQGGHWPHVAYRALDLTCPQAQRFVAALHSLPNCTSASVMTGGAYHYALAKHTPRKHAADSLTPIDALELVLYAYSLPGAPALHSLRTQVHRSERRLPGMPEGNVFAAKLEDLTVVNDRHRKGCYDSRVSHFLAPGSALKTLRFAYHQYHFDCKLAPLHRPWIAPPLESLVLFGTSLRGSGLMTMLSQLKGSLASLSIQFVYLNTQSWSEVIEFIRDTPFTALRRISLCFIYSRSDDIFKWCPLWRARNELEASCGGAFDFGLWNWDGCPPAVKEHVMCVRFNAGKGGAPGMKRALSAMLEYRHETLPKGDCESEGSAGVMGLPNYKRSENYERWTGVAGETMRAIDKFSR